MRAGGITGLSRLYEECEGRDDDRILPVRSRVGELF